MELQSNSGRKPTTSQAGQRIAGGCMMLFALPFAVMGLFAALAPIIGFETGSGGAVMSIVGFLFAAIGGVLLVFGWRTFRHRVGLRPGGHVIVVSPDLESNPWFPKLKRMKRLAGGKIALPTGHTRMGLLIVLGIVALIWNGGVWTILILLWADVGDDIGATVAMIAIGFAGLIGLGILYGFFRQLLKVMMVGETSLEVSQEPIAPGGKANWSLRQRGRFHVNRAEVALVCRELAQYRRGTDTVTVHEEVLNVVLAERSGFDNREGVAMIEGEIKIPEEGTCSFHASNNAVQWYFEVKIDIPGKPDVHDKFFFRVGPRLEVYA